LISGYLNQCVQFEGIALGGLRANRTLLPVAPTAVAMPPRIAGFGNRDRFELNGKSGLHRAAGQWQHNVALSGSIPLQPAGTM
jgi:hypothetical protein